MKLLDFGLARLVDDRPVSETSDTPIRHQDITEDRAIVGTLRYMAPEQIEGGSVGVQADVFAFGVLLYEMATGISPFDAPGQRGLMSAIMSVAPRPPSQLRPELPVALDHVVLTCLRMLPGAKTIGP